jgi:hypothetical protein
VTRELSEKLDKEDRELSGDDGGRESEDLTSPMMRG